MKTNIVNRRTHTPTAVATIIKSETTTAWIVECERAGCTELHSVAKFELHPTRNRDEYVQVQFTQPRRRMCTLCYLDEMQGGVR